MLNGVKHLDSALRKAALSVTIARYRCHAERSEASRLFAALGCAQTCPELVEGVTELSFRIAQRPKRCGFTRNDNRDVCVTQIVNSTIIATPQTGNSIHWTLDTVHGSLTIQTMV